MIEQVHLVSKLSWKPRIDYVAKKARGIISNLCKLRNYVKGMFNIFVQLYYAEIHRFYINGIVVIHFPNYTHVYKP